MQNCRGKHKRCYPPSNSPPFLPRILAGAQLETGAVHKLCSQQILFINRQIPSSARCFRPFQAKRKDLRYTNYLRSSLSLRYFSGEFLYRVAGGSTKFVIPPPIPRHFSLEFWQEAQPKTGSVHELCSQQILFINRQIPSSARCFRPFPDKTKRPKAHELPQVFSFSTLF